MIEGPLAVASCITVQDAARLAGAEAASVENRLSSEPFYGLASESIAKVGQILESPLINTSLSKEQRRGRKSPVDDGEKWPEKPNIPLSAYTSGG